MAIPENSRPPLDLSCVCHVFNAAEPVTPEACDLFTEAFVPYGFQISSLVPGYGLAEHVVYVCDGGGTRLLVDKRALEIAGVVREPRDDGVLESKNEVQETADGEEKRSADLGTSNVGSSIIIGCGFAPESIDLRIVDPETREEKPEDTTGEIWVNRCEF